MSRQWFPAPYGPCAVPSQAMGTVGKAIGHFRPLGPVAGSKGSAPLIPPIILIQEEADQFLGPVNIHPEIFVMENRLYHLSHLGMLDLEDLEPIPESGQGPSPPRKGIFDTF